jgi:hypothetical protein
MLPVTINAASDFATPRVVQWDLLRAKADYFCLMGPWREQEDVSSGIISRI